MRPGAELDQEITVLSQRLEALRGEVERLGRPDSEPEREWENMGTKPSPQIMPYLQRESEDTIWVISVGKDSPISQTAVNDAAQRWFRTFNGTYCTGSLVFQGENYYYAEPWLVLGRLQLIGNAHHHGGTQHLWTGGKTDSPMFQVIAAHGKGAGSNFCQTWRGMSFRCRGKCAGIRWGSANWGKLEDIFVEDPRGAGIQVMRGTNGVTISGCHVYGPGHQGGKNKPRKGSVGLVMDSGTVATLVGCKFEQMETGLQGDNNHTIHFAGTHFEDNNTDYRNRNWADRGGASGSITSFANRTGELVRLSQSDAACHLRGNVAETSAAYYAAGGQKHWLAHHSPGYAPWSIDQGS